MLSWKVAPDLTPRHTPREHGPIGGGFNTIGEMHGHVFVALVVDRKEHVVCFVTLADGGAGDVIQRMGGAECTPKLLRQALSHIGADRYERAWQAQGRGGHTMTVG